jgi:DNA-binding LacI/PurR family transcriptional regulator
MARSAARRLVERVENPGIPPVRIEFPIDLVIRKSCQRRQPLAAHREEKEVTHLSE